MRSALLPALLVIVALAAACGDDSGTPSASPSASPSVSPAIEVIPLTVASGIGPTGDVIVETGCTECDGPASGIARVSVNAAGDPHVERLFSAGVHFLGSSSGVQTEEDYHAGDLTFPPYTVLTSKGPQEEKPWITGLAVSQDGQTMAVSLCVAGFCLGDSGSTVAIYRSVDEGAAWSEIDRIDRTVAVVAVLGDGRIAVNDNDSIFLEPGREQLETPQTAGPVYSWFALRGGEIGWNARGGDVVRQAGTSVISLRPYAGGPYNLVSLVYSDTGYAASWQGQGDYPGWYLSIFGLDGTLRATYSVPDGFTVGAWLDDSSLVGGLSTFAIPFAVTPTPPATATVTNVPALVDLKAKVIRPVGAKGLELGRNRVLAWVPPAVPSPTLSPTPFIDHGVRPCTVDDLEALFGPTNGLTGGQILGGVLFGNRSDTACRLEGRPDVKLLDAAGAPIDVQQTDFCFGQPCVVQPVIVAAHSNTIVPHQAAPGQAALALYWPTYDNSAGPPCANPPAVAAGTVRIVLPEGGGTLDVVPGPTPCHILGVGVFKSIEP